MTHNIAIIPARGGSKRIPKKNIIDFDGKPMIAWTIEAAKKSNMFTKVLVSTDCEDIANVSRDFGAEVPFLRQSFADDNSPVSLATISALKDAEDYWKIDFDCVAQLMPNCPLRSDKDIVSALNIFKNIQNDEIYYATRAKNCIYHIITQGEGGFCHLLMFVDMGERGSRNPKKLIT